MRMFPSLTTFHRPPEWPHRPPITDFASITPLSGLIAPRGGDIAHFENHWSRLIIADLT